jgi:hypothetical protein
MKKEFIVSKIEASSEGSAYVHVILTDTGIHFSPTRRQQNFPENPFGIASIPITSLDDLKDLPKKISDAMEHAFRGDGNNTSPESTTFKMNSTELEELGIKVGDKVIVEIEICNNDIGV